MRSTVTLDIISIVYVSFQVPDAMAVLGANHLYVSSIISSVDQPCNTKLGDELVHALLPTPPRGLKDLRMSYHG